MQDCGLVQVVELHHIVAVGQSFRVTLLCMFSFGGGQITGLRGWGGGSVTMQQHQNRDHTYCAILESDCPSFPRMEDLPGDFTRQVAFLLISEPDPRPLRKHHCETTERHSGTQERWCRAAGPSKHGPLMPAAWALKKPAAATELARHSGWHYAPRKLAPSR